MAAFLRAGLVDEVLGGQQAQRDTPWYKQPVVKSLVTDPTQDRALNRFYDIREFTTQVHAAVNEMSRNGEIDKARQFLEGSTKEIPNKTLYSLHDGVNEMDSVLRKAREMEKLIEHSNLSPPQKRMERERIRAVVNKYVSEELPLYQRYMGE